MTYFTKRYHPPGTPPGTLVRAEAAEVPLRLSLIDYTDSDFVEKDLVTAAQCQPYLERPTITWIHIQGQVEPDTLRQLGEMFGLHALALEDVLNTGQRPKIDSYDDQLFVVMSIPISGENGATTEQVSLFVGKGFVVSFHQGSEDIFEPVRKRLRNHSGKIRGRGADYLLYTLLDIIIDQGFPVLEAFGEQIEDLEVELLESPDKDTLHALHQVKRELLLLRRMLWPQREVLNMLIRDEHPLVAEDTKLYFRDCYDHTIQIMDLVETYRDMTASMLDVYLSSISNRLNDVMRILTVIATIFIPLTFIVGIYGMNFDRSAGPWNMPELGWPYGYALIWLVMIAIAVGMLIYFKRRRWF